ILKLFSRKNWLIKRRNKILRSNGKQKRKEIKIMKIKALAHRGYPIKYPENTIKAFEASYELGFTHIELDVQLSKDGIPVIMHDQTINRTTNGKGLVDDYTVEELKQFRTKKG